MTRLLTLLCALVLAPLAHAGEPAVVVDSFHAALIDNMKQGQKLGCSGRIQHMKPAVSGSFDVPYLAQRILRRRWAEMSEAQRKQFGATLEEMVVSTYAAQFSSYNGESFAIQSSEEAGANRVVHSQFKHGNESVSFDYVLHDSGGGAWRIVNVIADGVSDLAIRSSQYESLLKQKGFDGLIAYLQEQIVKNKAGC